MGKIFSFVSCVNDELLYAECIRHIQDLEIPPGYNYECIAIRQAKSLTSGYEKGRKLSKGKFKIYLHQDTFIINKQFLFDLIKIFSGDPQIGLLGVVGAGELRYSCGWGNSRQKYGKVIENSGGAMETLTFNNVKGTTLVQCVDGLIMATQYDIPWRVDLFDGWHFYDLSQCMEFIRAGYCVAIPEQSEPWCIHDCGQVNLNNFDKYRYRFMKEYSADLFKCGYYYVFLHNKLYDLTRPFIKDIEEKMKCLIKENNR